MSLSSKVIRVVYYYVPIIIINAESVISDIVRTIYKDSYILTLQLDQDLPHLRHKLFKLPGGGFGPGTFKLTQEKVETIHLGLGVDPNDIPAEVGDLLRSTRINPELVNNLIVLPIKTLLGHVIKDFDESVIRTTPTTKYYKYLEHTQGNYKFNYIADWDDVPPRLYTNKD